MDRTDDRALPGLRTSGERSADELRRDAARLEEARRLLPRDGGSTALDRLAELAARLLGTASSQISLFMVVLLV